MGIIMRLRQSRWIYYEGTVANPTQHTGGAIIIIFTSQQNGRVAVANEERGFEEILPLFDDGNNSL